VVARLLATLADDGVGAERVILLGFSQGACLALDFAARNPRRYGGVAALSGGLIGSEIRAEDFSGSLDATPVFIGCSDVDPHIPLRRVEESAAICRALGAEVTARIYRGMGHTINEDEVAEVQKLIDRVAGAGG
jgi:predicted esterase